MTDKRTRRVMIINNIESDTIDWAIFILKSDKSDTIPAKRNNSAAYEAQRIINDYIRQVENIKLKNPRSAKGRTASKRLSLIFVAGAFIVTALVFAAAFAWLSGQC